MRRTRTKTEPQGRETARAPRAAGNGRRTGRAATAEPKGQPAEVEAESPVAMPQAAPMPVAAAMPGVVALADVAAGRGAAATGVPGLGAVPLPLHTADAAGDMFEGVVAVANVGLAANAEMVRAITAARSPWDILYAQARATQAVSEAWMREAERLFGMFSARR
jgi:hypothetical protein